MTLVKNIDINGFIISGELVHNTRITIHEINGESLHWTQHSKSSELYQKMGFIPVQMSYKPNPGYLYEMLQNINGYWIYKSESLLYFSDPQDALLAKLKL